MALRGKRLPAAFELMEARSADTLPQGPEWQYEPKWDGFRCLVRKERTSVELIGKSGKSLSRYFPEVVEAMMRWQAPRGLIIDGELVIERDGHLSFDALQMRLHPAESRIRKLAAEIPAKFIAFDLLAEEGKGALPEQPFAKRRRALREIAKSFPSEIELTPSTNRLAVAKKWLKGAGIDTDGVVAKRLDLDYRFGERAMIKVKRMRTADCVVGGFRYAQAKDFVGSLLLGLFDAKGLLHHVGYTSSIAHGDRPALTAKLKHLTAPSAFTGSAPGGPSRWADERSSEWQPVKAKLVVEVRYDHVTDNRFRHGTKFIRWRADKAPRQCTLSNWQVKSFLQRSCRAQERARLAPRSQTTHRSGSN
jgi:ATP-dependent DNA ligase